MANEYNYDVCVIGSGPGGYVAAIRATQLGLSAAIIEKDKPGGVCLNIGCIPSKSLIHTAESYREAAALADVGVTVDPAKLNYEAVYKKSRKAADRLSRGVQSLIKKNKIDYIEGTGKTETPHKVSVASPDGSTKQISAKNILIATGSRPREIPGFEFDEEQVISSTGALMLTTLPKSLVILGAGAIGMEFAFVMNAFGVDVTVVELLDRILPIEDKEVVEVLAKDYQKRGITMLTGTKATKLERQKTQIKLTVEGKDGKASELAAEKLLVAVGRAANSESLGLENLGIRPEKGFIPVGDYYQTSVPGVYAIGDVINTPLLAHLASKEGEIAVEHMAGHHPEKRVEPDLVPSAVYSEPQVASFGPTEEKATERGLVFKKGVFPYRGIGKAAAVESVEGMVKILSDEKTGEIIAAHAVGASATEYIHELLLAKKSELLPEDVATMIHAHPTISEGVMEAARAIEGWVIHI